MGSLSSVVFVVYCVVAFWFVLRFVVVNGVLMMCSLILVGWKVASSSHQHTGVA